MNKRLSKYSLGIGDRFAQQGKYQMEAILDALKLGAEVTPVWNKSFREHQTVGSNPQSVREEADRSVRDSGWELSYFVDADHIRIDTVENFISSSDFYTIDVADWIGTELSSVKVNTFIRENQALIGELHIPGLETPFGITRDLLIEIAHKFYLAVEQAGTIYRKIRELKGNEYFAVEVSMDEVEVAQTPVELLFILKLLSENGIPVNTIAPKFTGKFNKGIDYEGDTEAFAKEFEEDLLVIKYSVEQFGLPQGLKLSVHTGSDKFSLYPSINKLIRMHDLGLHLKTAGTTWLEELIGLAESGGSGLALTKSIYFESVIRYDELTRPYNAVLHIDRSKLPSGQEVKSWGAQKFADAIRHHQTNPDYNPHFRQLFHTAYKIAAEKKEDLIGEITKNREVIGKNVKYNLLERHIKPLFLDQHEV